MPWEISLPLRKKARPVWFWAQAIRGSWMFTGLILQKYITHSLWQNSSILTLNGLSKSENSTLSFMCMLPTTKETSTKDLYLPPIHRPMNSSRLLQSSRPSMIIPTKTPSPFWTIKDSSWLSKIIPYLSHIHQEKSLRADWKSRSYWMGLSITMWLCWRAS